MPIPDPVAGTRPPRKNRPDRGDNKNVPANRKGQKASTPGSKGGRKNPKQPINTEPLNPPFDPRMRKIGSPLNQSHKVKRGWVQRERDGARVDFLFNPSQLDLSHETFDMARSTQQTPKNDIMDPNYPTVGSSTSVKLLYDRTYELFSPHKKGRANFANEFGVWADVAAWYVFLGMLPEMPTNWEDSIIVDPPKYDLAYLFIGARMVFYGWFTGISVTYSHWSQDMVPARCAVDASFQILPYKPGTFALANMKNFFSDIDPLAGWLGSGDSGGTEDTGPPVNDFTGQPNDMGGLL